MQVCSYTSRLANTTRSLGGGPVSDRESPACLPLPRIYIGSINYDIREEQLRIIFGPFGPIRTITMSYDQMTQTHKGMPLASPPPPPSPTLPFSSIHPLLFYILFWRENNLCCNKTFPIVYLFAERVCVPGVRGARSSLASGRSDE